MLSEKDTPRFLQSEHSVMQRIQFNVEPTYTQPAYQPSGSVSAHYLTKHQLNGDSLTSRLQNRLHSKLCAENHYL